MTSAKSDKVSGCHLPASISFTAFSVPLRHGVHRGVDDGNKNAELSQIADQERLHDREQDWMTGFCRDFQVAGD